MSNPFYGAPRPENTLPQTDLAANHVAAIEQRDRCICHLDRERRAFRKQARAMGKIIGRLVDSDEFERASGMVECDHCGLNYLDHPQIDNGLTVLCDGRFVHL